MISSLIEAPLTHIWRRDSRALFHRAQNELFDGTSGYDDHPAEGMVVFGCGVLSPILAVRAAELVMAGAVRNNLYFTGGLPVRQSAFYRPIQARMAAQGFPDPTQGQTEANLMALTFFDHLRSREKQHLSRNLTIACAPPNQ